MDINVTKLYQGCIAALGVAALGVSLYFAYDLFFVNKGESPAALTNINTSLFGPKVQAAAQVLTDKSKKISLGKNDLSFTEKPLYKSFTDIPVDVPLSNKRGRPDPFVPYVAP